MQGTITIRGGAHIAPHVGFAQRATLLLASALTIMAGATISPSLPAIEARFAAEPGAALLTRLVLTAPALAIAICAIFAGGLADRIGRRPVLLGAVALYGVAGMTGLWFDTLAGILFGRILLGVAVAGIMTTATALIGDLFEGPARDRFMGLQSAFIGFGGLVFLTGGGMLADLHWRAPFAVYALAFPLIPAVAAFIPRRPAARRSPPPPQSEGAAADAVPGPGGRAVIAAVFAAALLNSLAFYLIPTQLPFRLATFGGDAPALTGLAIGIGTLVSALSSLMLYARARGQVGIAGAFGLGFALMAIGFAVISAAGGPFAIIAGLIVAGSGMGFVMPNLAAAAMAAAPAAARGRVAGGLTAAIFLGQFLSPLASQPWIATFGSDAPWRDAAILLALMASVAALLRIGAVRSGAHGRGKVP